MRGTDEYDFFNSCFSYFLSHDELSLRKRNLVLNKYIGFFKLRLNEIINTVKKESENADYKKYELEVEYNNLKKISKRMMDLKVNIIDLQSELENYEMWYNNCNNFMNYIVNLEKEHFYSVLNKNSNNMNENSIIKRKRI